MTWFPKSKHQAKCHNYAGRLDSAGTVRKYESDMCAAALDLGFYTQCLNAPGHGPDGLFCKMHARKAKEAKR